MKKGYKITIGIAILILGILLLGVDRLFISADSGSYGQSMTIITTIAVFLFLVGAIWIFRATFK